MHSLRREDEPQPLGPALWDWQDVQRVLIVRLRSIGDTVLTTPSLFALKRFLPHVTGRYSCWKTGSRRCSMVLSTSITIITLEREKHDFAGARAARRLRATRYDVVYNLHGGTTATL